MSGALGTVISSVAGAIGVILGGVAFSDIELPEEMPWGGSQALAKTITPGGIVTLSAMGIIYPTLRWSGIFSGSTALLRSRLLYAMLNAGAPVLLNWNDRVYTVVVSSYMPKDTKTNWIPYTISCEVLRDETLPAIEAFNDLIGEIGSDISTATGLDPAGLAGGLALNAAAAAVNVAGAAIMGTSANKAAQSAIASGASANATAAAGFNGTLAATAQDAQPGAVLPSTNGPSYVTSVLAAAEGAAIASAIAGYIARAAVNLANGST